MFTKKRIDVVSLGCSKNLVDSEKLLKLLETKGYNVFHDLPSPCGEYVVVNTCGFISDAKEESINLILELCEKKKKKKIGNLIVMGCLSQRYLEDLKKEIPEVDSWFGKFSWRELSDSLPDLTKTKTGLQPWERILTTPSHSAYLKISEGCDRYCSFCAIPYITGRHKSRPIDEIIEEAKHLVAKGVKEFNVIAQDLSSYGIDLYGKQALAELIDRLSQVKGVEWIRLHYAYPSGFPLDLLEVMAKRENVCKYLDIALQHIADPVLSNMNRHIDSEQTIKLLATIREKVPGIKIRTTLMTGFPGESEKAYEELVDFIKSQKFERMGAFAYSEEDDTSAAKAFDDEIPEEIKQKRLDEIMKIQQDISLEHHESMIGTVQKVIIDRVEGDKSFGRTQYDSPEVDPEVIINGSALTPGEFFKVKITEAYPFELIGEVIWE